MLADGELEKQCKDAHLLFEEVSSVQNPLQLSYPARGWLCYEYQLGLYAAQACLVWRTERKHGSGSWEEVHTLLAGWEPDSERPPWVGDLAVHRSHRSSLIRSRPEVYSQLWPNTPELMPIVYPQITKNDSRGYRLRITELDEAALRRGKLELPEGLYYDWNKREVLATETEGHEDNG